MIYVVLVGGIIWFCYDMILWYITEHYFAKKCNYDCSKCKNWHCQYHECERKRQKQK